MAGSKDERAIVTLGGEHFLIAAFDLDILQDVAGHIDGLEQATTLADQVRRLRGLVEAAVGTERLAGIKGVTLVELGDAAKVILRIAGLDEAKKRWAAERAAKTEA